MIYTTKIYISLRYLRRPPNRPYIPTTPVLVLPTPPSVYEPKKPTRLLLGDIICPLPLDSYKTEEESKASWTFVSLPHGDGFIPRCSPETDITHRPHLSLRAPRVGILLV